MRRLVGDAKTRMWSAVDMFSIVFEQREASAKYAEGNPKFTDLSRDDYEQIQLLLRLGCT